MCHTSVRYWNGIVDGVPGETKELYNSNPAQFACKCKGDWKIYKYKTLLIKEYARVEEIWGLEAEMF